MIKAYNFQYKIHEINTDKLKKQFNIDKLIFRPTTISFNLDNVPDAISNGIRRTLVDEVKSCALEMMDLVSNDETNCPYDFIKMRIEFIPLCQDIGVDIMSKVFYSLDVHNKNSFPIKVYVGDLQSNHKVKPLFNPTAIICTLDPQCFIKIDKIIIKEGIGRFDSKYNAMMCVSSVPQDLTVIPNYDGPDNGYVEKTTVIDTRRFLIRGMLRQCKDPKKEGKKVFCDAINNIQQRLSRVNSAINGEKSAISFIQIKNKAIILIPRETDTIGAIINKFTFINFDKKISIINYNISNHEDNLLTIQIEVFKKYSDEIVEMFTKSINDAITTLTSIYSQISKF